MTRMTVSWDGVSSSTLTGLIVRKTDRGGWGAVRDVPVSVPGRDGHWLFSENRGGRRIAVDFIVAATSIAQRRNQIVDVCDWLDLPGENALIFSDQTSQYWLASLASEIRPDEWVQLGKFTVEWLAQPYAFAVDVTETCATATGGSITNSDAVNEYPEVTITPLGGAATDITLTVGDYVMFLGGTWSANVPINVSSLSDTVTLGQSGDTQLTGAFDPDDVSMADVYGDFPILVPGVNTWTVTKASGAATSYQVCFRYRRRFR